MSLSHEEKEFLRAFQKHLDASTKVLQQLTDALKTTAVALERIAFPQQSMTFRNGVWTTDLSHLYPGGVFPPPPCTWEECGLTADDPVHGDDFIGGHPFRA